MEKKKNIHKFMKIHKTNLIKKKKKIIDCYGALMPNYTLSAKEGKLHLKSKNIQTNIFIRTFVQNDEKAIKSVKFNIYKKTKQQRNKIYLIQSNQKQKNENETETKINQ